MTDQAWIHEVVGRVATEVLERHVAELQVELVRRTVEEVQPSLAARSGGSEKLLAAVAAVQASAGQRDILNSLLDQTAGFCARSVLCVVKQEVVTVWQAIGFDDDEALRDFLLDSGAGLIRHVLSTREPATGDTTQMDARFLSTFGAPVNGECHMLPLFLKEKVAAILYADAGTANASCERAALDLLARFTSIWLEAQGGRKGAHDEAPAHETAPVEAHSAPAAGLAAHAPEWSQGPAAAAAPALVPAPVSAPAPAPVASPQVAAQAAPAPAAISAADADTHKRAQRFARLLIDEIKLYNKGKVEEGLKQKDLYDRLHDDIDKSRASYAKRYGSTAAVSGDYFVKELIRGLAQGDATTLGPNFKY
jgi:hypothetical protein